MDFILEKRGKIIGLEVKSNFTNKTSGLSAFQKAYHPDKILLVGNGGIPWEEFLLIDPNSIF